jgi:hypothetical protein
MRKIVPIANKGPLKGFEEKQKDLDYWLSRSPQERVAAVTSIIRQSMAIGQKMDRSVYGTRKMKP